ncbi:MAG: hypothetical protein HXX17_03670 [Geobacteraceae bacterium]|nr:hypothetical protein [Geobacteraceae bacterium]
MNLITTNLQLKLLSLLLAVVLWLFVNFETVDRVELPLTVTRVITPPGLVVSEAQKIKPVVRIEAPRILLLRQEIKGVRAAIDLSGSREGEMLLSDKETIVELIQGVKLVLILPLKLELKREEIFFRE